jgi:hypothetical protein
LAIDTTNDNFAAIAGVAPNMGLPLLGRNPTAFVPDLAEHRVFVVHAGCYVAPDGGAGDAGADAQASYPREGRGIEEVDLTTMKSRWLYQHATPQRLSGLVWVDGAHAFVSLDDGPPTFSTHWHAWDPSQSSLGDEVKDFPLYAPKSDGQGRVLGIAVVSADGATSNAFVSFDVATGEATTLVGDIFGDARFSAAYTGWARIP